MKPLREESIATDIAAFQPLGDFVLVKRATAPHVDTFLALPEGRSEEPGYRRGIVVAIGPGDKLPQCEHECCACHDHFFSWAAKFGKCRKCQEDYRVTITWHSNRRAEMYVRPGDEVVYTRAPANDVILNGEEYTVLHQQQHIIAVLEKEAA